MKPLNLSVAALLTIFLTGCGKQDTKRESSSEPLPANLIVSTEPPGAVDILAARKSATNGQRIVIKGRVGGQKDPFTPSRAIMTLSDLSLRTCDKSPMDKCETPWDSCCEPNDVIAANSISVQVPGPDGRPIKSTLSGVSGIAPMKQLVVAGIAKTTPGSDSLVIDAQEIFILP